VLQESKSAAPIRLRRKGLKNFITMSVTTWTIEESGARLDVFLAAKLSVSRGRAQKLIETTSVNGHTAKASATLRAGDVVEVTIDDTPVVPSTDELDRTLETWNVPVLYEDDHMIVLVKPRGLVVHPGAGQENGTLVNWLRASGRELSTVGPSERAGIVHRLDKETSGVMIVCKTDAAHWKMAADFEERRVKKTYVALVCGVPTARGRIEAPIARHSHDRKKMSISREGRNAITEFSVTKSWLKFALLDIDLLTGRTHQIRVHLAHIGNPVAGDGVYGGRKRAIESAPNDQVKAALEAFSGQALHAARIGFTHPVFDVPLEFSAPPPPEMQRVIDALDDARTS
jgi:23S rRNA pseudouridine1911/1915/1917 synthase